LNINEYSKAFNIGESPNGTVQKFKSEFSHCFAKVALLQITAAIEDVFISGSQSSSSIRPFYYSEP
jgi:hypothetical protein